MEVLGEGSQLDKLKPMRNEYAGIVLSLAKQEEPDTSSYDDPEIVYRVKKLHHAGLIVRSKKLERVEELLEQYTKRFADDFVAIVRHWKKRNKPAANDRKLQRGEVKARATKPHG